MTTSENQCHRLAGHNYVVEADYSLFAGCSRLAPGIKVCQRGGPSIPDPLRARPPPTEIGARSLGIWASA